MCPHQRSASRNANNPTKSSRAFGSNIVQLCKDYSHCSVLYRMSLLAGTETNVCTTPNDPGIADVTSREIVPQDLVSIDLWGRRRSCAPGFLRPLTFSSPLRCRYAELDNSMGFPQEPFFTSPSPMNPYPPSTWNSESQQVPVQPMVSASCSCIQSASPEN